MDQAHIRQTIGRLDAFPPLPGPSARLLSDELQAASDLAPWVEADPILAFHVLSQAFSRSGAKAGADLGEAVKQLGTAGVRRSALRSLLGACDEPCPFESKPHWRRFWRHALLTAHIARELAHATARATPEQAYAAGLLHDFGKWILSHVAPERASMWTYEAMDGGVKGLEAEYEAVGADHSLAGKWALEKAGFPEALTRAAWLHHIPAALLDDRGQTLPLLELIQTANRLAHITETEDGEVSVTSFAPGEIPEPWRLLPEIAVNACKQAHAVCAEWEPKVFNWTGRESVERASVTGAVLSVLDQTIQIESELALARTQLERSETLLTLHQALRDAPGMSAVLAAAADAVRRAMGISPGIVLAHDPAGGRLIGEAWKNQHEPTQGFTIERNGRPGRGEAALSERQLGALRSLARQDDGGADSGSIAKELQRQRGLIAVPMTWAGCVRGRIMFESENGTPHLNEPDYAHLLRIASAAGWALAQCQQRQASNRDAERLATVGMLGQRAPLPRENKASGTDAPEDSLVALDLAAAIEENLANITTRADALLRQSVDPETAPASIEQILKECQKAGAVLSDVQAIYAQESERTQPMSINPAIRAAIEKARPALEDHNAVVEVSADERAPFVRVEHQRLLRGLNALLEYLAGQPGGERRAVTIRTATSENTDSVQLHVTWNSYVIAHDEFEGMTRIDKAPHQHWRLALPLAAWRTELECLGGVFTLSAPSDKGQSLEVAYPAVGGKATETGTHAESTTGASTPPRRNGQASAKALAEWPIEESERAPEAVIGEVAPEPRPEEAPEQAEVRDAQGRGEEPNDGDEPTPRPAVLIIEEDEALRDVLAETLRNRDYHVETAANQASAHEVLASHGMDLVLWGLDDDDEPQTAVQPFSAAFPGTPIVLMSHGMTQDAEDYLREMGVRACLHKPFHVARLLTEVAEATGRAGAV